jgi:DNA polymerase-1
MDWLFTILTGKTSSITELIEKGKNQGEHVTVGYASEDDITLLRLKAAFDPTLKENQLEKLFNGGKIH